MPFSWIYGEFMNLRNALYARGVVSSFDLGAPVISVGNITTGGTGKTPFVAMIAAYLLEKGEKVCILTRGYGRRDASKRVVVANGKTVLADSDQAGDEPRELAEKLNGRAVIIADADRVAAAEFALRSFGASVFLLDDGFQHQRARRDLDIVLIDATDPFGGDLTLPFGRLREPLANLRRADLFAITRAELSTVERIEQIRRDIRIYNGDAPIIEATTALSHFRDLDSVHADNPSEHATRAFAFCGIGNPGSFFELLTSTGVNLAGRRVFPDHHAYDRDDFDEILREAHDNRAEILITTAKDAVKISKSDLEIPCLVAETRFEIDSPETLETAIGAALEKHRADQK